MPKSHLPAPRTAHQPLACRSLGTQCLRSSHRLSGTGSPDLPAGWKQADFGLHLPPAKRGLGTTPSTGRFRIFPLPANRAIAINCHENAFWTPSIFRAEPSQGQEGVYCYHPCKAHYQARLDTEARAPQELGETAVLGNVDPWYPHAVDLNYTNKLTYIFCWSVVTCFCSFVRKRWRFLVQARIFPVVNFSHSGYRDVGTACSPVKAVTFLRG